MFNGNNCTSLSAVSSFQYLQKFWQNFLRPNNIHYEIYYTPIDTNYQKYPETENNEYLEKVYYGNNYMQQPIIDNHDQFFNYNNRNILEQGSIIRQIPSSHQNPTNDLDTIVPKNTSKIYIEDLILPNNSGGLKDVNYFNQFRQERNNFRKLYGAMSFGYERNHKVLEPSQWHLMYPGCGAKRQSPINIIDNRIRQFPYHSEKPFNFENYFLMPNSVTLKNTGHSVELKFNYSDPSTRPFIEHGGLKYRYVLDQLHFHWGNTNLRGSEHAINSRYYAAEIHAVHVRSDYEKLKDVIEDPQGVLVIAYMLKLDDLIFDRTLELITNSLTKIVPPKSSTEIEPFPPSFLVTTNFNNHNIVSYAGSLTTPPCAEAVTWLIAPETLIISSTQLNKFRQLETGHGIMSQNNRPIQPMNRRKIFVISSFDTQNYS
ncbi:carbonic anhydrase 2-like [Chrysoperla carnea]|uniref:carbonic anhydrase 2-like n=1 Tax=Chrysoperla carnea TaxID=189513 RepID=UPI001D08D820|nr:carbonic anhydrase 2-like [Chrysoperla carnea]